MAHAVGLVAVGRFYIIISPDIINHHVSIAIDVQIHLDLPHEVSSH